MYIDGVYGNLKPDVPIVYIQKPDFYHTYLLGKEIKTFFKNNQGIQDSVPRIFGNLAVSISTENTDYIEIFVDGTLEYSQSQQTQYSWSGSLSKGHHILEVIAYNSQDISKDLMEVYII